MGAPFVWFDLTATDDGVHDFYTALFGWPVAQGAGDSRGWITDGDRPWDGFVPAGAVAADRRIPYVAVDDLDTATKRAITLDGKVVREETTGPRRYLRADR